MRKYSKKGWKRRLEERKGYKDFFEKHIGIIKKEKKCCEECGKVLIGRHSEVCHILPKSYFKSIATNDRNVIYLCEVHHNDYDNNTFDSIKDMKIFKKVSDIFKDLEKEITEKISYKHYERWQI